MQPSVENKTRKNWEEKFDVEREREKEMNENDILGDSHRHGNPSLAVKTLNVTH